MKIQVLTAVLSALSLTACGGTAISPAVSPSSREAASSSAVQTPITAGATLPVVKIGQGSPGAGFAPFFVALEKGYFKDAGIQPDYQNFGQTAVLNQLLGNGQLDIAITSAATASSLNEVDRGLDVKVVSSLGRIDQFGKANSVMVRKDLADGGEIRTVADLKGRKIGITVGKTGGPAYEVALALRDASLTLNDVNVADLGYPEILAAFKGKAIDAGFLAQPFNLQAERDGTAVVLASAKKPGHSTIGTLFSPKFSRERPAQGKAFIVALARAARDLQGEDFKSEANLAILSKYTKQPVELLKDLESPSFDPNLVPDVDTILDIQSVLMAAGQLAYSTPLPADRLVDASFSQYAAAKLGPYRR